MCLIFDNAIKLRLGLVCLSASNLWDLRFKWVKMYLLPHNVPASIADTFKNNKKIKIKIIDYGFLYCIDRVSDQFFKFLYHVDDRHDQYVK